MQQHYYINSSFPQSSSLSDFEILSQLGKGSFGFVYKVRRKSDNIIYALKKVSFSQLSQKEKSNSLNEIRILASIHNKHVIAYKDAFYDSTSNSLCLIMEYAECGDLEKLIHHHIKTKTYFNEHEILSIFIQITKGIKSLHDNNIMHRDIKSANIFMFKNDLIKIGDLNVSKIIKSNLKHTQTGTPFYASPEIWDNQQYDVKCDIWSLGCLLYEITTLKPPFRGGTLKMVYNKVKAGLYEPIPKLYSNSLAGLVFICLQNLPQNRPTCGQLLDLIVSKINTFSLNGKVIHVYDKDEEYNDDKKKYGNDGNNNYNHIDVNEKDNLYYNNTDNNNNDNDMLLSTIKIPNQLNEINSLLPKNRYVKTVSYKCNNNSNGSNGNNNNNCKKIKKPLLKLHGAKLPKLNVYDFKTLKKQDNTLNKNKTIEHPRSNINLKHNHSEINVHININNKSIPKPYNKHNENNNNHTEPNENKDETSNRVISSNGNVQNRIIKTPSPKLLSSSIQSPSIQTPIQEPSPVRLINQECPYFKKRTITPESNNNNNNNHHHNKGFGPRSYSQNRMKVKRDAKILLNPLRKIKSNKDFDRNKETNDDNNNNNNGLILGVPLFNKRRNLKTIEPNMKRIFNRPINIHKKYLKSDNYNNIINNNNNNNNNRKINTEKAIRSKQESINELKEDLSKINEIIKNISTNNIYDSNNKTLSKDSNIIEQNININNNNIIQLIHHNHQQQQPQISKMKFKINKPLYHQSRAISAYLPRNLSSVTPVNNRIITELPHQLSIDPVTPIISINQNNYNYYNNIPQRHINVFSKNKSEIGIEFKKRLHKHKRYRASLLTNDSDISKSRLPTIEKTDIYSNSPKSIKLNRNLSQINNLRSLSKEKEQSIKIPKMIQFHMKNYNDNNNSLFCHYKKHNPIKVMPMLNKGLSHSNINNEEFIDSSNTIDKHKSNKYNIHNRVKYKENLSEIDRMVMNMQVPKYGV